MPDWPSLDPREPRRPPRFQPMVVAIPLGIVLLLNIVTGKIDIADGFEKEVSLEAMARASLQATATASAEESLLLAQPTPGDAGAAGFGPNIAAQGPLNCAPEPGELYCLHTVSEGDSLASISTRYGLDGGAVPGWELLFHSNQPDLTGLDDVLLPGQVLRIPASPGLLHTVFPGDSVSQMAVDYDVTSEAIIAANALTDADNIQVGDVLFVPEPGAVPPLFDPAAFAEPEGTPEDGEEGEADGSTEEDGQSEDGDSTDEEGDAEGDSSDEEEASEDGEEASQDEEADGEEAAPEPDGDADGDEEENGDEEASEDEESEAEAQAAPEPDDPSRMSWPVPEPIRVTNYMSARHPLGMDLGLRHMPTAEITAAASGTVVFAGGDPCCSYGYYVIVDHGNGLHTLYAHFSKLGVRKGDVVARGQSLGVAGSTGYSTGVHLHFEVRLNGKRVNPMNYLPN